MINAEIYKREILKKIKELENTSENHFSNVIFSIIDKYSPNLDKNFENACKWLFSEYNGALLKDAKNLEAGDYIMVSNDTLKWDKVIFCFYYNNEWYGTDTDYKLKHGDLYIWRYARLPNEKE